MDAAPRRPGRPPPLTDPRGGGLLATADHFLAQLSPTTVERGSVGLILALGLIDYGLGPELDFSFVYLLPIGVTAWYGAARSGIFACIVAGAVWLGAASLSRPDALPAWIVGWNTAGRLITFLAVAWLTAVLRGSREARQRLALLDPLTGLANTRAFFHQLEGEIHRARRYGRIFTLAYLDLDHFKAVNDTLGHTEGDEVLRTVAKSLLGTLRANDLPARLGGDEFGLILPETPYGQSEGALAKVRSQILHAMREEGWPVTISLGAVTFETPVETADDAVRIADRLMYEVKESGGDGIRHILWTGEGEER